MAAKDLKKMMLAARSFAWLLVASLLVPGASNAAGGLNLGWSTCGVAAPSNLTFACDRNDGTRQLVGSFRAPFAADHLLGFQATMEICFPNGGNPSWWSLVNPGSCRMSSLSVNFAAPQGPCADYWSSVGGATGGILQYTPGFASSNSIFFWVGGSVDSSRAGPIVAGAEYFLFNLMLDNANTVGASACAGCSDPATIVFTGLILYRPGQYPTGFGFPDRSSVVTWQSASASCQPVPAKNQTWGAIKALYR